MPRYRDQLDENKRPTPEAWPSICGSMKAAADYAHWHGFFELQQDLYKLQLIHAKRLETGQIEPDALSAKKH
ncbi:hypothetical protein [Halioglobus sp. HI00S01]|uniref:hypothetical protein n=1 Tax=Halioglobus sp. HI00S01 TaxID=1822214 RepID=UPI0012E91A2B|nr:hypothetical protein [Halioglobus sp. HI00S01]